MQQKPLRVKLMSHHTVNATDHILPTIDWDQYVKVSRRTRDIVNRRLAFWRSDFINEVMSFSPD